jgi:GT2 family glycosyltransferase
MVILHDNDILVPSRYAAEVAERVAEGFRFVDLKRFLFYWSDETTERAFSSSAISLTAETIAQNLQGGSIVATKDAYAAIGGFDEGFVGWGGEDNDFWDRAEEAGSTYRFGYLPMIHLFHPPQAGKVAGDAAPAVARYRELEKVPPEERIRRLRAANRS